MSSKILGARKLRAETYRCKFCDFVQEFIKLGYLDLADEEEYLNHMFAIHGISR